MLSSHASDASSSGLAKVWDEARAPKRAADGVLHHEGVGQLESPQFSLKQHGTIRPSIH